jgi:hypothetical protein
MLLSPWLDHTRQMTDSKDKIIRLLAALLLVVISIAIYQRTTYEQELSSLRHVIKKQKENEANR